MSTVRHPAERAWSAQRRALAPTLEDVLPKMIAGCEGKRPSGTLPRLRIVHRLDKEGRNCLKSLRAPVAQVDRAQDS